VGTCRSDISGSDDADLCTTHDVFFSDWDSWGGES
jgi:hypothetical protein